MNVAEGHCFNCGRIMPTWTPQAIVDALTAWNEAHGRPPTSVDWNCAGFGHPTTGTVQNVFGKWGVALRAAGLRQVAPRPLFWTKARIADAVLDFKFREGRWPVPNDWRLASHDHPNVTTVYKNFGSWQGALKSAGKVAA